MMPFQRKNYCKWKKHFQRTVKNCIRSKKIVKNISRFVIIICKHAVDWNWYSQNILIRFLRNLLFLIFICYFSSNKYWYRYWLIFPDRSQATLFSVCYFSLNLWYVVHVRIFRLTLSMFIHCHIRNLSL